MGQGTVSGRLPAGIAAAAFDLDGTLVDSGLDFRAIRRELGFPEGRGLLEHIATLDDPAAIAHAHAVIEDHEMAGAASARWMPGARELLDCLAVLGVPTAILTRNTRAAVECCRGALRIPVDVVVTREDCLPKPNPDGLYRIARRLRLPVSSLVYVGDFVYDLQAARAAGALACLYRYGDNSRFAEQADWVVDHLEEVADAFRRARGEAAGAGNG